LKSKIVDLIGITQGDGSFVLFLILMFVSDGLNNTKEPSPCVMVMLIMLRGHPVVYPEALSGHPSCLLRPARPVPARLLDRQ